jgi:hypothetical protein
VLDQPINRPRTLFPNCDGDVAEIYPLETSKILCKPGTASKDSGTLSDLLGMHLRLQHRGVGWTVRLEVGELEGATGKTERAGSWQRILR